ncbi:hypothetical protein ACFP2T_15240 [Plantactinospora solaniradicis]|uniref:Uncharacterized protein n=1 Tax=Plantactinospora solaniradicis TaxID=1723736 RepID=A0ABW1K6T6_9ACTN
MGDVVAQIRTVLGLIDEAAVAAERAQRQAQQASAAYTEASRGTADRLMRTAVVDSRTAGEKAGKTARLLAEAAEHFTTYINVIAPGTVPPRSSAPEADASGEQVLAAAAGQGSLSSKVLGRTAAVRNADDGLQHAKKIATAIKDATGSGGVAVAKSPQPAITAARTPDASAGDALLAAFTVALLGIKGAEVAARLRNKARTKSEQRKEQKGDDGGRQHEVP